MQNMNNTPKVTTSSGSGARTGPRVYKLVILGEGGVGKSGELSVCIDN